MSSHQIDIDIVTQSVVLVTLLLLFHNDNYIKERMLLQPDM
jgi:hypothetical protein